MFDCWYDVLFMKCCVGFTADVMGHTHLPKSSTFVASVHRTDGIEYYYRMFGVTISPLKESCKKPMCSFYWTKWYPKSKQTKTWLETDLTCHGMAWTDLTRDRLGINRDTTHKQQVTWFNTQQQDKGNMRTIYNQTIRVIWQTNQWETIHMTNATNHNMTHRQEKHMTGTWNKAKQINKRPGILNKKQNPNPMLHGDNQGILGKCEMSLCVLFGQRWLLPWNSPLDVVFAQSLSYCWIMSTDLNWGKWGLQFFKCCSGFFYDLQE